MAEAILGRGSPVLPEDILDPIPVTSTTHGIKVTLKDQNGALMVGWPINCKDGSTYYNYTTNEKGQTIFSVNSGAANIFVNNYNGSYQVLDMNSKWTNIDAPVGMTSRINIEMEIGGSYYEFTGSKLFELRYNRDCELILVGAGGGGASGGDYAYPGGGGAGYLSQYNNQILKGIYNFRAGSGGSGGDNDSSKADDSGWNGYSGGTSYLVNTSYSAAGGSGGRWNSQNNPAIGGLGNGASRYTVAGNSPVSFAGGGGGYGSGNTNQLKGGSPYGGNGCNTSSTGNAKAGSRGGGGGSSRRLSYGRGGADGGAGLMRINIFY